MLNFKDWKLSSQDGTKATLKHANGHEMTIAMKALPKIQREQIIRLAKTAQVQKFDEGSPETIQADGSDDSAKPNQPQAAGGTHITINAAPPTAPQPAPVVAPAQNPAADYAASMAKSPAPAVGNIPTGSPNGPLNPNGQANPGATAQQAQAGAVANRQVESGMSKGAIPIEQQRIAAEGPILNPVQNAYTEFQNEIKKADDDVVINPHRYMDQMSAPKKALSTLGLILGGVGAGQLGSTDNPALRMLNSQIDRDIDAQKSTFANRKTVWGAYHDLFGDSVTTNSLAHATMDRVYDHSLKLLANQIGTPAAWARYLQMSAALANQTQEHTKNAALNVPSVPGYTGAAYDTNATAKSTHGTEHVGEPAVQQGPTTAQAAPENPAKPIAEREFLDSNDKPLNKSIIMSGINPNATEEELQEKGIYPKDNPRSKQMKDITTHEIPPLLSDDADQQMKNLQYDTSKTPFFNDINTNYKNAKFIDNNMKKMNSLYGQAIDAVEKAGVTGRVRDVGSHVVGGITGAVGSMFGHGSAAGAAGAGAAGALDTRETRLRDNALEGLESIINASLNGVKGVDAGTVHRWVQGAKPVYGDTPNDIKLKFTNLIDLVKGHAAKDHIGHLLR